MDNAAGQRVIVPRHAPRLVQPPRLQQPAHGGAAGAFARNQDARRLLGNEIRLRRQQAEIAGAPLPETEIVAHQKNSACANRGAKPYR